MASQLLDGIVESLTTGSLGVDDFMQAVQRTIEDDETSEGARADTQHS